MLEGSIMQNWVKPANICLTLLIIASLALIASDLVSQKLSHMLPKGVTKKSAPVPPVTQNDDLASYGKILEKGLFGKATEGKLVPITRAADESASNAAARKDLLLLGTAIGSSRETFALVQKPSTKEERVVRLGDKVFDIGTLVSVQKEMIEILAGGERIKILTPTATAEEEKTVVTAPAAAPAGGLATQVGAGSYVIDQRALNAALDNIGQAMTDARLLPSMKDGKVEGFRASEVKPAGVFGMVGINNGDVLLKINDFPIDSPDKAIQSFVTLKGQSKIKLDLIRDGKPMTLNYDIR
jgi:general secretion pathway protein C